jgi:hypothetical protein
MPINSEVSNVSRRRFLTVAGGAAAASSVATGMNLRSARAMADKSISADYPLIIDVSKADHADNPPSYRTESGVDAHTIKKVKKDQTFAWRVQTRNDPNNHYQLAILFANKLTPFVDIKSGKPVYTFYGSEDDEHNGGIGKNAKIDNLTKGSFEYYVAVYDSDTGQLYIDDPTIIIGDGKLAAEADLIAAKGELKKAAAAYPAKSDQIQSIEKSLRDLIEELKKH